MMLPDSKARGARTLQGTAGALPLLAVMLLGIFTCVRFALTIDPFFADYRIYYDEAQLFWQRKNPMTEGYSGGAFPWTYLLNLFYVPPFLPYGAAKLYGLAVLLLVYAGFVFFMMREVPLLPGCARLARREILLLCLAPLSLWPSVPYGNTGTMCCMFAFAALLLLRRKKRIGVVFLILSCIKPHATGLLLLHQLLTGQLFAVLVCAAVLLSASLFYCLWLRLAPLQALETLFANGSTGRLTAKSYGLFSCLEYMGVQRGTALLLGAVTGLAVSLALFFFLKRRGVRDAALLALPFCLGLSFWFYKNLYDEYIMLLPLIFGYAADAKKGASPLPRGLLLALTACGAVGSALTLKNLLLLSPLGEAAQSASLYAAVLSFFHLLLLILWVFALSFLLCGEQPAARLSV